MRTTPTITNGNGNGSSLFERADLTTRRSLVDLDPDLFGGLGPRELARVREIGAHVVEIGTGRWDPHFSAPDAGLGLLVLDGLLTRSFCLGDEFATELVGAGDLIRPWETGEDESMIVPGSVSWSVLIPTRLAVLGRQLASAAADCPGLVAALLGRAGRRSRSQGILTAIAHMKRTDARVLLLLWHVAERWGRVTSGGVLVPIRLTHQRIAELVGAQRPSVTAALSRMTARGLVRRTANRGYLLTDDARAELEILCRDGERATAPLMEACA
jgi:CRP/FNR family transcriptional regulator, cyclic AMP receptor protein